MGFFGHCAVNNDELKKIQQLEDDFLKTASASDATTRGTCGEPFCCYIIFCLRYRLIHVTALIFCCCRVLYFCIVLLFFRQGL